jgi:hypothetical protein
MNHENSINSMNKVSISQNSVSIYNVGKVYHVKNESKVFLECEGIKELTIHNVDTGNMVKVLLY